MRIARYIPALMLAACFGHAQAAELNLHAVLNGHNVVSATTSQATGEASATLSDDGKLRLDLAYGGLTSNVTGASLYSGKSTENGPVLMKLDVSKNETGDSLINEQFNLDDAAAQQMRDGKTYIMVTTIDHPDGAIRGQLTPQPVRLADRPVSTQLTEPPPAEPQPAPTKTDSQSQPVQSNDESAQSTDQSSTDGS